MSVPSPAVTRRQVLAALGVGAGAAAIASCSRSSSGDGRIRLAMFHAPESKLNPLTNDGSKLVRWSCAESLSPRSTPTATPRSCSPPPGSARARPPGASPCARASPSTTAPP